MKRGNIMDTFIKTNSMLIDIQTKVTRDNFDRMVDYLYSSIIPDEVPSLNKLGRVTFQDCHRYVAEFLYTKKNAAVASYVLQRRSEIGGGYDDKYGHAAIYELNREYLVEVDSDRFFQSVAIFEHEAIHILQALTNNNPEKQYLEILSIFGELLSLEKLSEKYNNNDIYINRLIARCLNIISCGVNVRNFEDEEIENQPDWIKDALLSLYTYVLGFIYAIRLLDLYHQDNNKIFEDFNLVLAGEKPIKALLSEYHISLEDNDTVHSFFKMVDSYREYVATKYGTSVHRVKQKTNYNIPVRWCKKIPGQNRKKVVDEIYH